MISVAEGIVLHTVPHKDSTRIIYFLSNSDEIITLYAGGFGKRRSAQAAIYYPGNYIEIELYDNTKSKLLKPSKANIIKPWLSVQNNFFKSTVLTFIIECVLVYFKSGHQTSGLYNTLFELINYLEEDDVDFVNVPIVFLLKISEILGVKPNGDNGYFNIKEGVFELIKHSTFGMEQKESILLANILSLKPSELIKLSLGNNERRTLLKSYLEFLDYHIDTKSKVLSLDVLTTVIND